MQYDQDMPVAPAATPDISVCIANYNGGDLVLDCLASVYAQQGDFTLEVLVHDDHSSDDSLARIRARYRQARTIASDANRGFCVSNNRMVAAATGRYALLLNNDAILRPDSLRRLLAFADDGNQGCLLGLPQYQLDDATLVDRGYRTDPFLNPMPMYDAGTHEAGVATGACLWVPRTTWDAIGGFPEWFGSVAEDIYLCMAARLLGHKVFVLDQPGFDHWVGKNLGGGKVVDGGLRTTARRRALSERNKTFVMLCCYPWIALILLLPLHATLLMVEAAFLLATGTDADKVRRIYAPIPAELWRQRHRIAALRRHLMARRRATTRQLFAFTRWLPGKLTMLIRHGRPQVQ